jgi:hypothetical protein
VEGLGYDLKVPGDVTASTVFYKEGTCLKGKDLGFQLGTDANFTVYRRQLAASS